MIKFFFLVWIAGISFRDAATVQLKGKVRDLYENEIDSYLMVICHMVFPSRLHWLLGQVVESGKESLWVWLRQGQLCT